MTPYAFVYSLHLLAALVWVGGMFFAWMVLRPAAVAALEAPPRLKLWLEVFPRFFYWVWAAVILVRITGVLTGSSLQSSVSEHHRRCVKPVYG